MMTRRNVMLRCGAGLLGTLLGLGAALAVTGCDVRENYPQELADAPRFAADDTDGVQVLAFTADWCGACQRDKPQLAKLQDAGVNVRSVDADAEPNMLKRHRVTRLPTYVVLEDGVEQHRTGDIVALLKILKTLKAVVQWLFF